MLEPMQPLCASSSRSARVFARIAALSEHRNIIVMTGIPVRDLGWVVSLSCPVEYTVGLLVQVEKWEDGFDLGISCRRSPR
jgi:hypothetical protein